MKLSILAGSTSQTVNVFIQDSSSTTGAGLAGLVYNSSGLTGYYALSKAAATAITLATLAAVTSAYSSGGFKEVDATNMPGWYRFDIPDAAIASGRFTTIHLKGATNMAPLPLEIELTAWNNQDGVRGGMTALPNVVAEGAGGLYTRGTGAGQLSQSANGELGVATLAKTLTTYTGNTVQTGDGYAIVNSGTFGNSALKTLIDTVDDFVDTEVAAILAAVDTEVASIKTQTDKFVFTVANQVNCNPLSINGSAVAAANLALASANMLTGTVDSTAVSPSTTVFESDDITEATADHFKGRIIVFTSGALQYQATTIGAYALNGGRGHFTVTALTEAPSDNGTFIII